MLIFFIHFNNFIKLNKKRGEASVMDDVNLNSSSEGTGNEAFNLDEKTQ